MAADARRLAGAALADALRDARATTLARTLDQDDDAWNVPQQPGVNLPAWELGHLAWFAEFWILRGPHRAGADGFVAAAKPPTIAGPDAIFDSARLAHADRWRVALPSRAELATRLARPARRLHRRHPARRGRRRRELLPPPRALPRGHARRGVRLAARDARLAGAGGPGLAVAADARAAAHRRRRARARPRAPTTRGFAFDNEQPAMPVRRRAVRDRRDAAAQRGVRRLRRGRRLRRRDALARPGRRLARAPGELASGALAPRRLGRLADALVRSLAAARRRRRRSSTSRRGKPRRIAAGPAVACRARPSGSTPRATRASSGAAASGNGPPTPFLPYPGFVAGPYADYSRPWFGDHRELRGGAFATAERLHDPRYRNFFVADRNDVFAGFRTAALQR